ncbi:MAG: GGDEF domain-containing protein [Phycisphaerae bacterium]
MGIRPAFALAMAIMVASSVLGSAAVFSKQLQTWREEAELPRVLAMAEVYAAQAGRLSAEAPTDYESAVASWGWHPAGRLLAVLDTDDRVVAARGDRRLLADYLQAAHRPGGLPGAYSRLLPASADPLVPRTVLAAVMIHPPGGNLPMGRLVYAARALRPGAGPILWPSLAMPLAVSGLGAFLGLCLLWHNVLRPLRTTLRVTRQNAAGGDDPGPGGDEIEDLLRSIAWLQTSLDESRQAVARLEQDIERRVRSETQRMSQQLKQVERKAWLDPLTRLGNRRMLDEHFEELFNRHRQSGQGLSLVMMDLDYFKQLNDTLGHKAGDELIAFVGELLRQTVREGDLAIRYGGDEFLLILPNTSVSEAATVADRVVKLFGQRARLYAFEPKPGMSAGVASLTEHRPASAAAFIQMADQALYRAKSEGKARVCAFKPGRVPARV